MAEKTLPPLPDIDKEIEGEIAQSVLPLYKIIMWNDDVTTMEFVVRVLVNIFGKDYLTAEKIMYEIHHEGRAIADSMPLERAEFKVDQVHDAAALAQFPFKCTIEPF